MGKIQLLGANGCFHLHAGAGGKHTYWTDGSPQNTGPAKAYVRLWVWHPSPEKVSWHTLVFYKYKYKCNINKMIVWCSSFLEKSCQITTKLINKSWQAPLCRKTISCCMSVWLPELRPQGCLEDSYTSHMENKLVASMEYPGHWWDHIPPEQVFSLIWSSAFWARAVVKLADPFSGSCVYVHAKDTVNCSGNQLHENVFVRWFKNTFVI